MMNIFLKMTACIYRPYFLDSRLVPLEHPTGYSFPSGHTARVTSCFGSFAFVFWKNKWIRYSSIVIIFLVMFSRNYLGVHTPQDVIVSFIITFLLVFIIKRIFDIAKTKKYGFFVLTFVTTILCILLIVYLNFKTYPIDYINGKIVYDVLYRN